MICLPVMKRGFSAGEYFHRGAYVEKSGMWDASNAMPQFVFINPEADI